MRINRLIAQTTGMSRRAVDKLIEQGQVLVNGNPASLGHLVSETDTILLSGRKLEFSTIDAESRLLIMLNKPTGYVVSREGQGSKTIYELLPPKYHHLKPIGRLDKDSSGLLLLTNDGLLANQLTHPRYRKEKIYEVELDKPLSPTAISKLKQGILLEDGISKFPIESRTITQGQNQLKQSPQNNAYTVHLLEGRNRQIRRTFAAIGYRVVKLHRTKFGAYGLSKLQSGAYKVGEQ